MPTRRRSFLDLLYRAENYRSPKNGDRLLRCSEDWDRGVDFSNDEISRHVHMSTGYMTAGAALIEACEADPHNRHFLIYPILFNYRHSLELEMKWIIARYGSHTSAKTNDTEHHDLWQLWKRCKVILSEIGGDSEAIPVVEQVIKDFHELDKSSLAFRYSQDKKGAVISLPDQMVDLENIRDVMEAVKGFFDGADGLLDANVSAVDR